MPLQSTCPECNGPCMATAKLCQSCRRAPMYVRFWRYVDKSDDCWDWTGAKSPQGRGHIGLAGRTLIAAHVAWSIAEGAPIPRQRMIGHTCDNPTCVRNDERGFYIVEGVRVPRWGHLFLGTILQNNRDKMVKGRATHGAHVGLAHHFAKLSSEQVAEIRALRASGLLQREIAARYGVNRVTISRITRGKARRAG